VDRAESERIKERMGRGKRERARQGKKNSGPAPYGFENPLPGVAGRGTLQIVEAEAVVVRRIFTMFAQVKGKLTIAKALNESGVPSPKGREWGGTTVARLVQNPAYVGVAAANVWVAERGSRTFRFQPNNPNAIMIEGAYPAIVDKALWDAVHKRTKQPRTNRPRMLSGLLYINGRKAGGDTVKKTAWYVDAARKPGCPWLRVDEVDAAVWERFAALATGPEFVEKLLREAQDPRQQELARMEVEWLTSEITKAERRLERLVGMRADDEIDKPTFAARSRETRTSIEEWKRQLVEQQAKAAVLDSTHADRIVAAVRTMLAGRTRLTTEQKRQLLASIVRRVDVTAQKAATRHVRGEGGRILPGEVPQWETKAVGFQLALPSEAVQPELAIETARRSGSAGSVVLPVSESDFVAGEVFSCAPSCPVTAST
jgi:site-specific DNA recombinase